MIVVVRQCVGIISECQRIGGYMLLRSILACDRFEWMGWRNTGNPSKSDWKVDDNVFQPTFVTVVVTRCDTEPSQ